ncbi:MAG TPA: UDP-N-acetylmuramoyl-tripeptide--D-alanyl-D-alanine ligase [Thermoanaerobaculia bacterium]|nr:UDP-N-acetylmuramoyl-tripeptide--D-alanyl-D-alanine ligase [Thermoanaerobaculia bacterium]
MPTLTFQELADMIGGTVIQGGDVASSSVVIDSREVKPDSVFFAIRGERLDGHRFLPQALQTARGAVVSEVPADVAPDKGIVRVDDTTVALQKLSTAIRERHDFLMIGITGSAGKTTTKEMIATLIGTERRTHKSWGNFNNLIGAPLCVDNTPDGTEVVVSEMGMNHKGEIAQIAGWTRPNIGVYTVIAPVHIEFFEDGIDGIAAAKRELLENLAPGGKVVVNADNEHVVRIARDFAGQKVTYGVEKPADYHATNIRERGLLGSRFTLEAEGATREFELVLPGRHNLENLLAAIATARLAGIAWDSIERGVKEVQPAYHRGVIIPVNGATLYDDTYNSNPYALGRTLTLMAQADVEGRRIAVIGDMLELGEQELDFHRDAGKAIPDAIDVVIGVGKRTNALLDGAREAGFTAENLHHFDDATSAGEFLKTFIRPGDLVLLKGSRGVGLDKAVAILTAGEGARRSTTEGAH